ncbi:hypothetical protein RYX36_015257 [Vicia faba]
MMNKKVINGSTVRYWACINFSRSVQESTARGFCQQLVQKCRILGMEFSQEPLIHVYSVRPDQVKKALKYVHTAALYKLDGKELELLIAILPDINCSLYGDLKRICETDLGLISQCCLAKYVFKTHRQYLANVTLKLNVKMGGRNTVLLDALSWKIPLVSDIPTIIFGADVTHAESRDNNVPSIAAVVASQDRALYCEQKEVKIRKSEEPLTLLRSAECRDDERWQHWKIGGGDSFVGYTKKIRDIVHLKLPDMYSSNLPQAGQWNMMNKKFINGSTVRYWACINFSRSVQESTARRFCQQLVQKCRILGMEFSQEPVIPVYSARPDQVKKALKYVHTAALDKLDGKELELLIAILLDINGSLYGDLKRICETDLGLISQCCLAKYVFKTHRQYLANVTLKLNVKMGGRNTVLLDALSWKIPLVSDIPTIIFGADVTHAESGDNNVPYIVVVVASQDRALYCEQKEVKISKSEEPLTLLRSAECRDDERWRHWKIGEGDSFVGYAKKIRDFTFPALLEYQGVINFVSDSGLFYQDLVRYFYVHLSILMGCAFTSVVRGGYTLELIYNKLHEMDIRHSSELHALLLDVNLLKQQNRHQSEGEEDEEEEEEGEEENNEMHESD